MASIEATANWPQATTLRGINDVIYMKWAEREAIGRKLFNVQESTQYREHSLTVGGVNLMQEIAEGEAVTFLSNNEGFLQTYTHLDYANGFQVTRRMYRDELYGLMENLAKELALAADATEETLLALHLDRAEDSNYTGADGVELSSQAHVRENGSTYSNELTAAADLSQTSLEQALIDFSDFRSGGGRRLKIPAKYLVVPVEETFNADRLLGSQRMPEDSTNAVNPLHNMLTPVVWHYLTDADRTFLMADKEHHSMTLFTREELWTDYEYDFDTSNYKIKGAMAQSSGWGDPKGIFCLRGA